MDERTRGQIKPFMSINSMFFCFLLLPSISFNPPWVLASADSTYENFANCLARKGVPNDQIAQILNSPTNASFISVLNAYVRNLRFNTTRTKKPSIIVTPLQVEQAQEAVLCTKESGLQLKIRSGGHDYEGISYVSEYTFVVLDMFNLRNISVDVDSKTAWVQAGATLGELYYRIGKQSNLLGFPAGVCSTVGVGGHISGGGYGPMLRKFGLTVDNVIDAQIIDVNGKVLDRTGMGEDLFWAIRGGGGASFGVVLAYKINLVPVPPVVTVFKLDRLLAQNATDILVQWQNVAAKYDENIFIRILVYPVTVEETTTIRLRFRALYLGDAHTLLSLLNAQIPTLGLTQSDCVETNWMGSMLFWMNFHYNDTPEVLLGRTPNHVDFLKRKSDYVLTPIPKDVLTSILNKMVELGKIALVFNPYGGRMSQIPESDAPFPHRAGIIYKIQYSVNWDDTAPNATEQILAQARELYSFMTPYVSSNPRQAFLNYRDLDIGTTNNGNNTYNEGKVYGLKYFKENFDRLVKVKTAVDPGNFFRNEQSIPPLPH